jgi:CRISPR-associated endonuclease/helicase Cas3
MDLSRYNAKPNKTIRQHTDELIANLSVLKELNYIKNEHIYNLTRIACEYHDYGKVNKEFQRRLITNDKFNENTEVAHNVLSLYFINKEEFEDMEDYYKVAFAVLNHHSYCDNFKAIEDEESKMLAKDLLSDFKVNSIKRSTTKNIRKIIEDEEAILTKGFLHKCDYSASGEVPIEHKNNFLNKGLENLLYKWKLRNNDSSWNELQQFCKENCDKNIIAIAQTGMGKTEAGLHWIGDNKGFFILPLKTAINSIYTRISKDVLEEDHIESKIALLHSDTLSYYNSHKNNEMDTMDYYNQSKQLSIPINISTLDQLFDFVFKYQGYELKLATLSYSKIVIDEIQMYGADLLAYLIYGIKVINKFGGRVAILTATLAPFIKDKLKEGENSIQFEEKTFINDLRRHNIKVYDEQINSEIIYQEFEKNKKEGISNKILVVCNTVKKAQQIYMELLNMGVSQINLLHSKFIKCERQEKENEILEFGKSENIGTGIWISTQIVEASLDIDFDYLFTELSDISGLFQRLGRCNRKGIKSIDEYNCFIFLSIDNNLLTNGNKGFIDRKMYELSKEALMCVDGVLTENDKINIINKYLTTENLRGSDYEFNYNKFYKWIASLSPYEIKKDEINLRNIISYDVIPNAIYKKYQRQIDEISLKLLTKVPKDLNKLELDKIRLEKIKLREEIKSYTVPVGIYDIYFKGTKAITTKIQLSKNEFINVVDCQYNELGFIRLTSKDGRKVEDNFDNFL